MAVVFGSMPVATSHAWAAKASPEKQLKQNESEMEAARKKAAELDAKAEKIKQELAPLQKELVALADALQSVEARMSEQEAELTRLQAEQANKQEQLTTHRRYISQSISAMVDLQYVPPQALVARPGGVKDTIRAGQLLAMLSEELQRESAELQVTLSQLQEAQAAVTQKQEAVRQEQDALDAKKRELEARMKDRTSLQAKLIADRDSQKRKLDKLAKQSKSLKDLIAKLERESQRQAKARVHTYNAKEAALADKRDGQAMRRAKKQLRLPVQGKVVARYGSSTADGATNRGVRIRARGGATVTAPFKGSVVFTGPFLDYGKMVIIRHPGGYHTLLAGISQIRCTPGQMVVEGEPIGSMGSKAPANELYLELRDHSSPVNPAEWFAGL